MLLLVLSVRAACAQNRFDSNHGNESIAGAEQAQEDCNYMHVYRSHRRVTGTLQRIVPLGCESQNGTSQKLPDYREKKQVHIRLCVSYPAAPLCRPGSLLTPPPFSLNLLLLGERLCLRRELIMTAAAAAATTKITTGRSA